MKGELCMKKALEYFKFSDFLLREKAFLRYLTNTSENCVSEAVSSQNLCVPDVCFFLGLEDLFSFLSQPETFTVLGRFFCTLVNKDYT